MSSTSLTTHAKTLVRECIDQFKHVFKSSLSNSRTNKIVLTVSIGAIGVTIVANFYIYLFSLRNKKRILNKSRHLIEMIPELKSAHVKMKNPNYVELILSNLINGGKQRLQVVSDFDRTISKCSHDGKSCVTSNAVLEMSRFVTPELREKFETLRNQYLPIEHDTKLTKEEKIPYMIEWWTKSFDLTVATQIHRENLSEIVRNSPTHLREGCQWFFYTLERHDIPLLIFSAGLGNIIQEWIVQQCGNFKNIKIISNFMNFSNVTNKITGFQGSIIHVFNKNEGVLLDTEYEKLIENRPNVILLGDSTGDVEMAAGFPTLNNILKIGFLNNDVDELLPKYMEIYDIVAIKDSTFDVPNAIIRSIV